MRQQLTREKLFNMWFVLRFEVTDEEKLDKRFVFARNRNLSNLASESEELIRARNSGIPAYNEFQEKKRAVVEKYCARNEGRPVIDNGQYVFDDEQNRFKTDEEVAKLTEQYSEAIEQRRKEIDIYNELIRETVEVDVVQTSFEAFPPQLTGAFLDVLRPMIRETDEEIEKLL